MSSIMLIVLHHCCPQVDCLFKNTASGCNPVPPGARERWLHNNANATFYLNYKKLCSVAMAGSFFSTILTLHH